MSVERPEWNEGNIVRWQATPDKIGQVVHNPPDDPDVVMVDVFEEDSQGDLVSTGYTENAGPDDLIEYEPVGLDTETVAIMFSKQSGDGQRVYVDSPDEVPEGKEPQEGEGGGIYYETGGGNSAGGEAEDGSEVDLQESLVGELESVGFSEGDAEQVVDRMSDEDDEEGEKTPLRSVNDFLDNVRDKYSEEIIDDAEQIIQSEMDGEEPMPEEPTEEEMKQYRQKDDDDPCWEGYEQVGMKEGDNGGMVPDCVPEEDAKRAKTVQVGSFDEVPDDRAARKTFDGDVYYTVKQKPYERREKGSDRREKMDGLHEGMTWDSTIEVVEIDQDADEVVMSATHEDGTWTETMDNAMDMAEDQLESDHDYIYTMIAEQYPDISEEDAEQLLHSASDLAEAEEE